MEDECLNLATEPEEEWLIWKVESLGDRVTGRVCDAAGLGSYRQPPCWPPLHHKPQRHTAGGQQVQSLSPRGVSRQPVQKSCSKPSLQEEGESAYLLSPSLSFTMHGAPSPGSKSAHPAPSIAGGEAQPSASVTSCSHGWTCQPQVARVPRPTGDHAVSAASRWGLENLMRYVRLHRRAGAGVKIVSKAQKYILLFINFCQISLCTGSQDYDPDYRSILDILRSQGRSYVMYLGVTFHVHSNPSPKTLWSTVKAPSELLNIKSNECLPVFNYFILFMIFLAGENFFSVKLFPPLHSKPAYCQILLFLSSLGWWVLLLCWPCESWSSLGLHSQPDAFFSP